MRNARKASLIVVGVLTGLLLMASANGPQVGVNGSGVEVGMATDLGRMGAVASVDTFKLLVTDHSVPNSVADDTTDAGGDPWVFADSYYDTVADYEQSMRYGTIYTSSRTTMYNPETGIISTRRSEDNNGSSPTFVAYLWFDTSHIPANSRIEEAYIIANVPRNTVLAMASADDYVCFRADTLTSDYAMLESNPSTDADPQWLDISYDYVDASATTAWTVDRDDLDDMHDYGPRSETLYMANRYGPTTAATGSLMRFNVTDAVQQVIDNGNNGRGIIFVWCATTGVTAGGGPNITLSAADNTYWAPSGNPVFTCISTSRRGARPWGGTLPVSMVMDDAKPADPDIYALLDSLGYEFSSAPYEAAWSAQDDSLFAANGGAGFDLIGHGKSHDRLGTLTGNPLQYELSRDWYPAEITGFGAADTADVIDFAWPAGGAGQIYSYGAIEAMIDNGFRTARAEKHGTTNGVGPTTYPSWNQFVNLYTVSSVLATVLVPSGASTTRAEFDDRFWDYVDKAYTDGAQAGVLFYTHGFQDADGTGAGAPSFGPQKMRWFYENIAGANFLAYRPHTWIMNQLASRPFVDPATVTVANGATQEIEGTAARYANEDTVGVGATWADSVWVGPK